MARVLVTVLAGSGWVHKLTAMAAIQILRDAPKMGHDVMLQFPTFTPLEEALSRCRLEALNGGFEYWLSLDDDTQPLRNPLELIERDLDVVGCVTPVWHCDERYPCDRPWYPNALTWDEQAQGYRPLPPERWHGIQEVDAVGFGCVLIARRVLEAVSERPFRWEHDAAGLVTCGQDFAFCRQARAAGFRVWASFTHWCRHVQTLELLEVLSAHQRAYCRV